MNPEIAQKWADALRSGEYNQGHDVLRGPDDTFCCLGVLCEIAVQDGVIPQPTFCESKYYLYDRSKSFLPNSVVTWAGLDDFSPLSNHTGDDGDEKWSFVGLNDGLGMSFEEIADVVVATFLSKEGSND